MKHGIRWEDIKCLCCCGEIGSGKTATCYTVLSRFKKPKYIYSHPQPHLLQNIGINNLEELNFDKIIDCALYIDEPQLCIPSQKDKNALMRLFSLARQRDINIIFSTSDSRWTTKAIEAYIDGWLIKDVDFSTIKQGSTIKRIISNYCNHISPESFTLPVNEALFYCRKQTDRPKRTQVPLPKFWNETFSKPYKIKLRKNTTDIFSYDIENT